MWKRRASYDPMKAAAEGKKKMEEAKKMTQQQQSNFNDRCDAFLCLFKLFLIEILERDWIHASGFILIRFLSFALIQLGWFYPRSTLL